MGSGYFRTVLVKGAGCRLCLATSAAQWALISGNILLPSYLQKDTRTGTGMPTITSKSSLTQISLLLLLKPKTFSNFCQSICRLFKQPFIEGDKGTFLLW